MEHIGPPASAVREVGQVHASAEDRRSPVQHAADALLASGRSVSPFRFMIGSARDVPERLGRVLRLREMAVAAETTGRYVRADFLWREISSSLQSLVSRQPGWSEFTGGTGDSFVRELFVDVHWALYAGLQVEGQQLTPEHRCFVHLQYVRRLLQLCTSAGLPGDSHLIPHTSREVHSCLEAREWDKARGLARELLRAFRDEPTVHELATDVEMRATVSGLGNGESPRESRADAARLASGVERLERLRADAPACAAAYGCLAQLHHLRAVKLANGGEPAEALLAIEQSLACEPGAERALKTRDEIRKLMKDLQQSVRTMLDQLKTLPNATLNEDGLRLQRQAQIGSSLATEFLGSNAFAEMVSARWHAIALSAWRAAGFASVSLDDPRPVVLLDAMERVARSEPRSKQQIAARWKKTSTGDQTLAALDAEAVTRFLAKRLLAAEDQLPSEPDATGAGELPAPIVPESPARRLSVEPVGLWLFSRQAIGAKAFLVVAVLILAGTATLARREGLNREARNVAYNALVSASQRGNHQEAMRNAEAFLSTPLVAGDAREEEVRTLYSESLVRWVVGDDPSPELSDGHLRLYGRLVSDPTRQERP